jgi:ferredoxin
MAYVITEPCIGVTDASCTEMCPVDCIHPMPGEPDFGKTDQLYIDPSECIDCDACVTTCPVNAISPASLVSEEWQHYVEKNAAYFRQGQPPG